MYAWVFSAKNLKVGKSHTLLLKSVWEVRRALLKVLEDAMYDGK